MRGTGNRLRPRTTVAWREQSSCDVALASCAHRLMGGADNFYADNVTTSEDTVRCVALEIMAQHKRTSQPCQS
jgi:hypothetical protein